MVRLAAGCQRASESATSSIGTQKLSGDEIAVLVQRAAEARYVAGNPKGRVAPDALGGAAADGLSAPVASALTTVRYIALFTDGADPASFDAYVRGFGQAMAPACGSGTYADDCEAAIIGPSACFDVNTSRLHRLAEQADPGGLLDQPHWLSGLPIHSP